MPRIATKLNKSRLIFVILILQLQCIFNELLAVEIAGGVSNNNSAIATDPTTATYVIIGPGDGGSLTISKSLQATTCPIIQSNSSTAALNPNILGNYTINIEKKFLALLAANPTTTPSIIDFKTASKSGKITINNNASIEANYGATPGTVIETAIAIDFKGALAKLEFIQETPSIDSSGINEKYIKGNIVGSNSSDTIRIRSGRIYGNLSLADGANIIEINNPIATAAVESTGVTGNLLIGNGGNTFTISKGTIIGNTTVGSGANVFSLNRGGKVTGNISFGDGINTFTLDDGTITGAITFGTGNNNVNLNTGTITGSMAFGSGNNVININSGVTLNGSGNYVISGQGSNTINLLGRLTGNINMSSGKKNVLNIGSTATSIAYISTGDLNNVQTINIKSPPSASGSTAEIKHNVTGVSSFTTDRNTTTLLSTEGLITTVSDSTATGSVTVNNGLLTSNGKFTNSGSIFGLDLVNNGEFTIDNGTVKYNGSFTNNKTLIIENAGDLSGITAKKGDLINNSLKVITVRTRSSIGNNSVVGAFINKGTLDNSGVVQVDSINNEARGTINLYSGSHLAVEGNVVNNGILSLDIGSTISAASITQNNNLNSSGNINAPMTLGNGGIVLNFNGGSISRITGGGGIDTINITGSISSDGSINLIENICVKQGVVNLQDPVTGLSKKLIIEKPATVNILSGGDISGGGIIKNSGSLNLMNLASGGTIGNTLAMGNLNNYGSIVANGGDVVVGDFINNLNSSTLTITYGNVLVNSLSNKLGSVNILEGDLSIVTLPRGATKPNNFGILSNGINQSITIAESGHLGSINRFDVINNNGIINVQDDASINCIDFNNIQPKGRHTIPVSFNISGGKALIGSVASPSGKINNYFGNITINSSNNSFGDLSSASSEYPTSLINYNQQIINVLGNASIGDHYPLGGVNNQGTINISGSKVIIGDFVNGDATNKYRGVLNITKGNIFVGNINNDLGSIEIFSTTDSLGNKYVGDLSSASSEQPSILNNRANQIITIASGTMGINSKLGNINNEGIINVNNNIRVGNINNKDSAAIINFTGGISKVSNLDNNGKISISSNGTLVDLSSINLLENTIITNNPGSIININGNATLGANGRLGSINNNSIINASGSDILINNFSNDHANAELKIFSSKIKAKQITNNLGKIVIKGGDLSSIDLMNRCELINVYLQSIIVEGNGTIGNTPNYHIGHINNYGNITAGGGNIIADLFTNNKAGIATAGSGGSLHIIKGNLSFGNINNDYGQITVDAGDVSGIHDNTAVLTNSSSGTIVVNLAGTIGAIHRLKEINNSGIISGNGGNIFTGSLINNATNAQLTITQGRINFGDLNNKLGTIVNIGGDLSGLTEYTADLTNATNQTIRIADYGTVGATMPLDHIHNNGTIEVTSSTFRAKVLNNNTKSTFNLTSNNQSGVANVIELEEINNQGSINIHNNNISNSTSIFRIERFNNLVGGTLDINGYLNFRGNVVNNENATINLNSDFEFINPNIINNNNNLINRGSVLMHKRVRVVNGNYLLDSDASHIAFIRNKVIDTLTLATNIPGTGGTASLAAGSIIDFRLDGKFILNNQEQFTVIDSSSPINVRDLSNVIVKGNTSLISYVLSQSNNDLIAIVNKKPIARLMSASANANDTLGATLDNLMNNSQDLTDPNLIDALCHLQRLTSDDAVIQAVNQLTLDPVIGEISAVANNTFVPEVVSQRMDLIAHNNTNHFKSDTGYAAGSMQTNDGLWFKGLGGSIEQNNRGRFVGYNANSVGVAIGLDTRLLENTWIGLGLSSVGTHMKSKDSPARRTNVQSYQITFYGSHSKEQYYMDLYGAMALNNYKTRRNIDIVNQTALAKFKGFQPSSNIALGYIYKNNNFNFIPNISLHYSKLYQNPYNETGVTGVGLQKVSSTSFSQLQLGTGIKITLTDNEEQDKFYKPDLHFMLLHDFKATQQAVTAQFMGGGGSFKVSGAVPDKTTYNIGAGVIFVHKNRFNFTANYEWRKKNKFIGHSGSIAIRYEL